MGHADTAEKLSQGMLRPLAVAWFLAVAAGLLALLIYKSTPAAGQSAPPPRWPRESRVHPDGARATLLLFAHPKCPCTRASIAELAELMARFHDRLDAYVLFLAPRDAGADFADTDLWSSAKRIPGVSVLRDDSGEAGRFGIATSGSVALYDREGRLAFHGGITPARGHQGDSFGRQRIASLLTTGAADRVNAPVFGCALQDEDSTRIARAETR